MSRHRKRSESSSDSTTSSTDLETYDSDDPLCDSDAFEDYDSEEECEDLEERIEEKERRRADDDEEEDEEEEEEEEKPIKRRAPSKKAKRKIKANKMLWAKWARQGKIKPTIEDCRCVPILRNNNNYPRLLTKKLTIIPSIYRLTTRIRVFMLIPITDDVFKYKDWSKAGIDLNFDYTNDIFYFGCICSMIAAIDSIRVSNGVVPIVCLHGHGGILNGKPQITPKGKQGENCKKRSCRDADGLKKIPVQLVVDRLNSQTYDSLLLPLNCRIYVDSQKVVPYKKNLATIKVGILWPCGAKSNLRMSEERFRVTSDMLRGLGYGLSLLKSMKDYMDGVSAGYRNSPMVMEVHKKWKH